MLFCSAHVSRLLTDLKYAGSIRRPPGIQQIVFTRADKPFAAVGEFEWQDTAFMQMKLVLVRLWRMKHFNVTALHSVNATITSVQPQNYTYDLI